MNDKNPSDTNCSTHTSINGTTSPNSTNNVPTNEMRESTESWQDVPRNTNNDGALSTEQSNPSHDSFMNVVSDEKDNDDTEEELYEENFDLSVKHKSEGNKYYKLKDYQQALMEYTLAIDHCPKTDDHKTDLSIFYGNRAACYIILEDWEVAVEECTIALDHNDKYIKALWRRARAYEKLDKYFDAKQDYQSILDIEGTEGPNYEIARVNLQRIEPLVQQQFEKQKDEVMGQLKGFANWGLGKIGLSLDNFQSTQDPNTGAYNINFKQ
eukprot:863393_1